MRDEASVKRLATLEAVALAPARLVYSVWIALAFLAVGVAALVLLALLPGDARRVLRNASNGQSLVFFPEGTFTRTPGLLKFHTGAFVTAARVGCPVGPAVVRGTRRALPPSGALASPGRIELEILTPITGGSASLERISCVPLCSSSASAPERKVLTPMIGSEPSCLRVS